MDSINGSYKCDICNKLYSSYKSLWNHNKRFHINEVQYVQNVQSNVQNVQSNDKIIKCEYCNKIFKIRSTKSEHKKKSCKLNPNINNNELIELKNKNIELENSLKEIKELLINSKIHHKTLQKINKQLNTTNNNTTNNNTTNNNTTNNNTTNNNNNITNNNNVTINNTINLVSLGSENLSDVLNKKEKLNILRDMLFNLIFQIKLNSLI
jgi:DNA-directed RNA polymerase subunit RPC12/RpoP